MKTIQCDLCSHKMTQFLDLGKQPMANKYPKKSAFKSEKLFPVQVFFCSNCKGVQLGTLVSRDTMFKDYYYLSSVNKVLVEHYEKFAHTKLNKAKFVVDVGSNDGISLKPLKEMGIRCLGIDPSINVGKIANAAGFETMVAFLDKKSVRQIVKKHGKPDVVTGLSMFSHLQNPHLFLEDVKSLMSDDGRLIVEVEYNKLMLQKLAFERFYLDRIFYFSATSFSKLFEKHGMYLADVEVTDIHGGSLRVTAQKQGHGKKPTARVKQLMADEKKNLTPKTAKDFGFKATLEISKLGAALRLYRKRGLTVAGYGAPARVSTLTNFGGIGSDLIDFIVDDSPLKQNRFSPGKHIPIVPNSHLSQTHPDVLLFFAYESFKDIKKRLPSKYKYLFPIPVREVK